MSDYKAWQEKVTKMAENGENPHGMLSKFIKYIVPSAREEEFDSEFKEYLGDDYPTLSPTDFKKATHLANKILRTDDEILRHHAGMQAHSLLHKLALSSCLSLSGVKIPEHECWDEFVGSVQLSLCFLAEVMYDVSEMDKTKEKDFDEKMKKAFDFIGLDLVYYPVLRSNFIEACTLTKEDRRLEKKRSTAQKRLYRYYAKELCCLIEAANAVWETMQKSN
ncbi:MAG: hypothetical protein Q4B29_01040 [Candidatus Saccharibacteria bacterium]|nr:hypothetical protein [Candidatus Saccharibacteria bacterium]